MGRRLAVGRWLGLGYPTPNEVRRSALTLQRLGLRLGIGIGIGLGLGLGLGLGAHTATARSMSHSSTRPGQRRR
jgi:hypothetical protein